MIANNIRLSRVSHPRATLWAVALLIIVFLGFGIWAETSVTMTQTSTVELNSFAAGSDWLTGLAKVLK